VKNAVGSFLPWKDEKIGEGSARPRGDSPILQDRVLPKKERGV
jgi:hypothetical protein